MSTSSSSSNRANEDDFPEHSVEDAEVVGREYDLSAASLRSNSITFGILGAVYAITAAVAGFVGLSNFRELSSAQDALATEPWYIPGSLLALIVATAYVVTESLARARFSFVVAARKIVIIRELTNVKYGRDNLILPNWRYEAARSPFAIRLFEGWRLRHLYPLVFSLTVLSVLFAFVLDAFDVPTWAPIFTIPIFLCIFVLYYRGRLFERDENWWVVIAYTVAKFLNVKLDKRRAYLLYSARLSVLEAKRIGLDYSQMIPVVVFREDRTFDRNIGISLRGILRATWQTVLRRHRQGGSTISQQLFRSVYIIDYHKTLRRKIVESFGAIWIKSSISNQEILNIYICSVRYAPRVFGIAEAKKHFEMTSHAISRAEAFFLTERLSNLYNRVRTNAVLRSVEDAVKGDILTIEDSAQVRSIYQQLVTNGTLLADDPGRWNPSPAPPFLPQTPSEKEPQMPAQSEAQQKAAGAALSAKRGDTKVSDLQGASKEMYDSMSESELEDLASTSHDNLPEKKGD
jgi:penicillin-binding protein 1A